LIEDEDKADRLLVELVIAGQPGAIEEFVDRFGPVVVRVLRRFRISQQDRDDCWQDVFLKLIENDYAPLRAWRGESLPGYIAIIAKRVVIDLLRTRNPEVPWDLGFDPPSHGEAGDDIMGLPPPATICQIASACLTTRHFEIYERYCRGENAEQTGKALNIKTNHVYVERHRMIRALRKGLKESGLWP